MVICEIAPSPNLKGSFVFEYVDHSPGEHIKDSVVMMFIYIKHTRRNCFMDVQPGS